MILDTSFLIDLFLNKKEAVDLVHELEANEILKTTSISVFEIFQGIRSQDKINKISQFFDDIIILSLDKESAKLAGIIFNALKISGAEIDPEDCMIAAITKLNNDILLTRNVKHFKRINELKIREY